MKKTLINFTAITLTALLCGCQSLPAFHLPQDQKTFSAFTYYGKERPSGFFTTPHGVAEDNGYALRGYHSGKKHWPFKPLFSNMGR